jgi:hypothetical protein
MGYGSRTLKLLQQYYEGKFTSLDETASESNQVETLTEAVSMLERNRF